MISLSQNVSDTYKEGSYTFVDFSIFLLSMIRLFYVKSGVNRIKQNIAPECNSHRTLAFRES